MFCFSILGLLTLFLVLTCFYSMCGTQIYYCGVLPDPLDLRRVEIGPLWDGALLSMSVLRNLGTPPPPGGHQ